MSIQSQIERINANISDTYTALEGKGATMPSVRNTDNLASTVLSVKSGGFDETDLDNYQFITTADIDTICNSSISVADLNGEVRF